MANGAVSMPLSNNQDIRECPTTRVRPVSLAGGYPEVLVSVPERALLELLSDAGKYQTLEETSNLVESARNLREPTMDVFLAHVKRIKVVRLARLLSEKLELSWAPLASRHSERLGGADRRCGFQNRGAIRPQTQMNPTYLATVCTSAVSDSSSAHAMS